MNDFSWGYSRRFCLCLILVVACTAMLRGARLQAFSGQPSSITTNVVHNQLLVHTKIYVPAVLNNRAPSAPSPVISAFGASPTTITPGGEATLSWTVQGATSLRIEPEVGPVQGSNVAVKPATTTTYTLIASDGTKEARAATTVTVSANGGGASSFVERDKQTSSPNIVIDAQGGTHIAYHYHVPIVDKPNLVYAYCPAPASRCDDQSRWQRINLGGPIDQVQLALTRTGHPRIVARGSAGGADYQREIFYYGECDRDCFVDASWSFDQVAATYRDAEAEYYSIELPERFFALDAQDRPRFVFYNYYPFTTDHRYAAGDYYAQCDADCANHENWVVEQFTHTVIINEDWELTDNDQVFYPSLTFTTDGAPRIVAHLAHSVVEGEIPGIYYFACDAGCENDANWTRARIADRGNGPHPTWDIEVDNANRPRVAFYDEPDVTSIGNNRLYYLTCDGACADGGRWATLDLGLAAGAGNGADLELDHQGRPRIAYLDAFNNLDYAWCDSACVSNTNWSHRIVETGARLDEEFPVPIPPSCDGGFWDTLVAMLAVDDEDNPHVAYRGTFQARCYENDPNDPTKPPTFRFKELWHTVRLNSFPQP